MVKMARASVKAAFALFLVCAGLLSAAPLDIQKIRLKGAQNIKELRYFQD